MLTEPMTTSAANDHAKGTNPDLTCVDVPVSDHSDLDAIQRTETGESPLIEACVEKPQLSETQSPTEDTDDNDSRTYAERAAMQSLHEHAAELREQLDAAASDYRDLDADAARTTAARSGAAHNHNRILRELVSYELFTRVGTDIEWPMDGGRCSDPWMLKGKIVDVWRTFLVLRDDDGQEQIHEWYDADNQLLGLPMELDVAEPSNRPDGEQPF